MAELIWIESDHHTLPPTLQGSEAGPAGCRKLDDLPQYGPTSTSLLVAVPATCLDDTLVRSVQSLGDRYPGGIGLLPVFEAEVNGSLLSPDLGESADTLTWAAISAHESKEPLGNGIRAMANPSGIAERLRNGPPINVFAGVLNGRQTFVHLDSDLLLHPGVPSRICQSLGVVSCLEAQAHHWLIQSCHSPFTWSDLGNYLTVPLALTKNASAKSVIVSTRVQTYVPRLLEIYAEMVLDGCTTGVIAQALNATAEQHGCDIQPFLLLGNPDTRVVKRSGSNGALKTSPHEAREAAEAISQVANLLQNLATLVDGQFLNFQADDDASKQFRALIHQIRGEFNHRRGALRSYEPTSRSVIDRWDSLAATEKGRMHNVTKSLGAAWKKGFGYYYHPSDAIESYYVPFEASLTAQRCASCESLLYSRKLTPASVGKTWRAKRIQLSCPRCLIVLDASEDISSSVDVVTQQESDSLRVTVRYRNNSAQPQLLLPIAHWNDPNNLSVRASRNRALADTMLRQANATHPASELVELAPGKQMEWSSSISKRKALFYCLLEFNLFVDFEWNWCSATLRQPHLSEWLESADYRGALDPNAQ